MKEYIVIPQEKNTFCVCSVLQSIFSKYKIFMTQNQISQNLSPAEKGFYVDDEKISKFLKSQGFDYEYYWKNEVPLNEPSLAVEDIVKNEGFIGFNYHVYLINNFKEPKITLTDPRDGSKLERDIYSIRQEMEESDSGYFCLMKKIA